MCFDYEGETVHFGSNIDRRKTELLVADIAIAGLKPACLGIMLP
jgi:hypothetical protein